MKTLFRVLPSKGTSPFRKQYFDLWIRTFSYCNLWSKIFAIYPVWILCEWAKTCVLDRPQFTVAIILSCLCNEKSPGSKSASETRYFISHSEKPVLHWFVCRCQNQYQKCIRPVHFSLFIQLLVHIRVQGVPQAHDRQKAISPNFCWEKMFGSSQLVLWIKLRSDRHHLRRRMSFLNVLMGDAL